MADETEKLPSEAIVARMTPAEARAQLSKVGFLLHELRPTFDGMQILWIMPLTLRLIHRGEDLPVGDTLAAPRHELEDWVRAFVHYLLAVANFPDVDAQAVDDSDWALAQAGTTRAAILTDGRLDELARRRIERLVFRVVDRCWREASTAPVDERANSMEAPRRSIAPRVSGVPARPRLRLARRSAITGRKRSRKE